MAYTKINKNNKIKCETVRDTARHLLKQWRKEAPKGVDLGFFLKKNGVNSTKELFEIYLKKLGRMRRSGLLENMKSSWWKEIKFMNPEDVIDDIDCLKAHCFKSGR